jgi:hypothetical protein
MIPPRTLNGENYGNGVSYRVTECRKRLRLSRTFQRPGLKIKLDDRAPSAVANEIPQGSNQRVVFAASGAQEETEST